MNNIETLLLVNSGLLALIGILFGIVGFFVRDMHKDFKRLASEVNSLAREHHGLHTRAQLLEELTQKQISRIFSRLGSLEAKVKSK